MVQLCLCCVCFGPFNCMRIPWPACDEIFQASLLSFSLQPGLISSSSPTHSLHAHILGCVCRASRPAALPRSEGRSLVWPHPSIHSLCKDRIEPTHLAHCYSQARFRLEVLHMLSDSTFNLLKKFFFKNSTAIFCFLFYLHFVNLDDAFIQIIFHLR